VRVFSLVGVTILCLLKAGFTFAINPIDVKLEPSAGLPPVTQGGNSYVSAYTFTNNLSFAKMIHVTATTIGAGFTFDNLCNNVTLQPRGQAGSSCTTQITFSPVKTGFAKAELTLKYDNNVIYMRPPFINDLSTTVQCGTVVFPSNTGSVVPDPIIESSQV